MKIKLSHKSDTLKDTPWELDVASGTSDAMKSYGVTLDFHKGGISWSTSEQESFIANEFPQLIDSLKQQGVDLTSSLDGANRGDADRWYIEPSPNKLSAGISIHSPVLRGEEGIAQANKVMKALHAEGFSPSNEPTLCLGSMKQPGDEQTLKQTLDALPWIGYPEGNGLTPEKPVSLNCSLERRREVGSGESLRVETQSGSGARPLPQAFENYLIEHPELGVQPNKENLLFRGTKHIDPELNNRSKAGILFASDKSDYACVYGDREDLIQSPFSQSPLPMGMGFLSMYEKAAGQTRLWASDRMEDYVAGIANKPDPQTRLTYHQKVTQKQDPDGRDMVPHLAQAKHNEYRMGDTLLLSGDRHVATFLVDVENKRMIDVRDIPDDVRTIIRERQFSLESQYAASRPVEQIRKMVAQSQVMSQAAGVEPTSNIVIPRLKREAPEQEGGREYYQPITQKIFPEMRINSRGNPKLQSEVLGYVEQKSGAQAIYESRATPAPITRQQQKRLDSDFAKVSAMLEKNKPADVKGFLDNFRNHQMEQKNLNPQSRLVDEQILGQQAIDPNVKVNFFHNTKGGAARGGR